MLIHPPDPSMLRARRRQLWHSKSAMRAKPKKRESKRPTIDGGVFSDPPPKPRKTNTLQDKLKVVDMYLALKAERHQANKVLCEPKNPAADAATRKAQHAARQKAKDIARKNIRSECAKLFPDIVGKAQVCKWVETCAREAWREIPETIRHKIVTTNNEWRRKLGLPLRGRTEGGGVPLALQRELDVLVMEHTAGLSEISERREVVTAEQIEPWTVDATQD